MKNKLLLSKIILFFVIIFCLGAVLGAVACSLKKYFPTSIQQAVKPEITPVENSGLIVGSGTIDLSLVPADWGKAIKIDNYYNYGNENKIPNIYTVNFANNVNGVFQDGVNLIVYSRVKERGKCNDYMKKLDYTHFIGPFNDNDVCYITEKGIYNLNTKKSVILMQNSPFNITEEIQAPLFWFFDSDDKKTAGIFSPLGKYFAQYIDIYEGCGMNFIDVATGQILGDQEENYMIFNCDPLVNFSKDEKTFAVRSMHGGMASSETQFSAIQGNKQFEILPKIISGELELKDEEINPVDDFIIKLIDGDEVKFDIIKDTAYYKKGFYVFIFSADEVIKE